MQVIIPQKSVKCPNNHFASPRLVGNQISAPQEILENAVNSKIILCHRTRKSINKVLLLCRKTGLLSCNNKWRANKYTTSEKVENLKITLWLVHTFST